MASLVASVRQCRSIGRRPALADEWGAQEIYPGPDVSDDEQAATFGWLNAVTKNERFFVQRHMRLEDPLDVFKYTWSVMYCLTVSLAYGGMGLGTVWGEELARKMMTQAGFSDVRTVHLPGDLINCYHLGSVTLPSGSKV